MGDAKWGNAISGTIDHRLGNSIDVLINDDLGPEPAAHGVLLFRETLSNAAIVYQSSTAYHAEITFGGGAAGFKFLCDWRGQFSLVCQSIAVRAVGYQTTFWTDGSGEQMVDHLTRYRHGAVVGFGGWHAARPLTYTARQEIASEFTVAVPPLGRRFFPLLGHSIGSELFPRPGMTLLPMDIARTKIGLVRPGLDPGVTGGAYNGNLSSRRGLTPADLVHGIEIGDAAFVRLSCPRVMMLTPTFELAL